MNIATRKGAFNLFDENALEVYLAKKKSPSSCKYSSVKFIFATISLMNKKASSKLQYGTGDQRKMFDTVMIYGTVTS